MLDFMICKDDYGYYISGYRIIDRNKILFPNNYSLANMFNLSEEDFKLYLIEEFSAEEISKDKRQHFQDYFMARECQEGMRKLAIMAKETGNLKFYF